MSQEVDNQFDEYIGHGSGTQLRWVRSLDITLSEYSPLNLNGSSVIPLPAKVKVTRAVINMQNGDTMCFANAVARALNPVGRNPGRITGILKAQADNL